MKSLRERFEQDYMPVAVPANNRDGFKIKYIYYGPWYYWSLPKRKLKKKKMCFIAISFVNLLLYLMAGTRPTMLNSRIEVFLPGIFGLCMNILEISACIQFLASSCRTSRLTFQNVDRVLTLAPLLHGIAEFAAGLMCGWYMLQGHRDMISIMTAAGYLLCSCLAFFLAKEYDKIPFETEKNTEADKYEKVIIK